MTKLGAIKITMRFLSLMVLFYSTTAVHATVLFSRLLDSSNDLVFEAASEAGTPEQATKTNSCDRVKCLPERLRYPSEMYPSGLTQFHQKYTEAYRIPVVSSNIVPDDALKRAYYFISFMMADHSGIVASGNNRIYNGYS